MSGVKGATVELDNIGGTPANNILVRPLNSIPSVPSGGYIGAMGKSAPVAELRQALSAKLDVPSDVLSLAYAGRDLNDSLTLRDNGIVEPGAAARRSGARIELVFALLADAVPGEARRKLEAECREQAERVERQRLEREATQARIREENAALDAEQSRRARLEALEARLPQPGVQALAAAAVAQPQRPAEAQPAPAAWAPPAAPAAAAPEVLGPGPAAGAGAGAPAAAPAAAAPLRDNCVLRCLPIGVVWEGGEGQDPALALETRLSARVTDVARQLQTMLGGGHGGDALLLVFRGHVVGGRGTLAAAGVEDGSEIQYYFAAPGEAPAAAGGDEEEEAALAAVAAAEAGAAVAAREAEAQERARRMAEQEAQWRAQDAATRGAHAAAPAEAPAPAAAQPPPEEEDLYGPPEPSSAASGGGAGPAAAAVTAFRTVPALEGEEARALLEELRRTLARPRPGHTPATASAAGRSSERMTEAEIAGLLRRHVPDIGERTAAGGDETPVAKLVVAFYRHGPTGVTDAATKERLAAALRHVLAAAREGDKPGSLPAGHRRALCRRLVEAFQGGQAAQIRIVEVLAEGLAAGADAFSRAALALALEERERALDRAVARMHPEAALAPEQLEQLASLYRQRLGFSGSLQEEAAQSSSGSGIPAPDGPSRAVRPRLDVPAALSSCEETARVLAECLDLGALAMELVADVNRLPGEQEERQVDLAALRQWAEAQREGEGGGREIFYDASKAELYSGRPADESQPFLHPLAAVKVLRGLLLGIGESGGQAPQAAYVGRPPRGPMAAFRGAASRRLLSLLAQPGPSPPPPAQSGGRQLSGRRRLAVASLVQDVPAAARAPASIFERIAGPEPAMAPKEEEGLEMFRSLASPSDVPLQFTHAARNRIRNPKTWETLSASAISSLPFMRISEVAAVLHSCAQASWRSEHLLCGLAEALRCNAELGRGHVRDYTLCCQALRRLGYCPWPGALRPLATELVKRLDKHRWRALDLVLVLRFAAEFSLHQMPRMPQGALLCQGLRERAEERLGEMRHLELAHFARAVAQLGPEAEDDLLLERVAENFSRRARDVPFGALLHVARTLLRSRARPPAEFLGLISLRAQAELARLRPWEVSLLASCCARWRLRDAALLRQLGRAVGSNLDAFGAVQVAQVAEAFDLLDYRHGGLLSCIEEMLLHEERHPGAEDVAAEPGGRSRCRLLAAYLGAAASEGRLERRSEEALERCAGELARALAAAAPAAPALAAGPSAELEEGGRRRGRRGRARVATAAVATAGAESQRPPEPRRLPVKEGRRKKERGVEGPAARQPSRADHGPAEAALLPETLGGQLDALREIAGSLASPPEQQAPSVLEGPPTTPEAMRLWGAQRRSRRGGVLEVAAFAPAGAAVVKTRSPRRRHFERVLGGRHPAALRLRRKLLRLEAELGLAERPGGPLRERGLRARRRRRPRNPLSEHVEAPRASMRGLAPRQRALALLRRLQRYRLSGFDASLCAGRFAAQAAREVQAKQVEGSEKLGGLSLEHAALLSEALSKPGGQALPGRQPLLKQLGISCARLATDGTGGPGGPGTADGQERRRRLAALSRVGAALAASGLACPPLAQRLEALTIALPPPSPSALSKAFIAFAALEQQERSRLQPPLAGSAAIAAREAALLRRVLLPPFGKAHGQGRSTEGVLWALPLEEAAEVLEAVAGLVQDPSRLQPIALRSLHTSLRKRLVAPAAAAAAPALGAQPPPAGALARLAGAWLWLGAAAGEEAPEKLAAEACRSWAVPLPLARQLAAAWARNAGG